MEEQASTEAPPADVSEMPIAFYGVIWIGVFAVVTWGFMHVFGTHRSNGS